MANDTRAFFLCPMGMCPDCDEVRRLEQESLCPTRAARQAGLFATLRTLIFGARSTSTGNSNG